MSTERKGLFAMTRSLTVVPNRCEQSDCACGNSLPDPKPEISRRHEIRSMLLNVGLRPTRQRLALGAILFAKGDQHMSAEMLHVEAIKGKISISLATVYNTLHQFTKVGLLREVTVDGTKTYFDTNVSPHHHFFVEGGNELIDIPDAAVRVGTPTLPEGYQLACIEVVIRLRRKTR